MEKSDEWMIKNRDKLEAKMEAYYLYYSNSFVFMLCPLCWNFCLEPSKCGLKKSNNNEVKHNKSKIYF